MVLPKPGTKRSQRRDPGGLEAEVLAALWASESPMSPGDVQEALDSDLAYTTVMTTLTRLYVKGLLARERGPGRAYLYRPVSEEAGYLASGMRALLETGHDHGAVFSRFVDELSPEDSELLAEMVRHAEQH